MSEVLINQMVAEADAGIEGALYALQEMIASRFAPLGPYMPEGYQQKIREAMAKAADRAARVMVSTGGTLMERRYQAYTSLLGVRAELTFLAIEIDEALELAARKKLLNEAALAAKKLFMPFLADMIQIVMTGIMTMVARKLPVVATFTSKGMNP